MRRLAPLLFLSLSMWGFRTLNPLRQGDPFGHASVALGFVLLAAYILGHASERVGLPRLTGYIFAGVVFGPYCFGFLTGDDLANLRFIDDLALSLIAFAAGGHLKWKSLAQYRRAIVFLLLVPTLVVFSGITVSLLVFQPYFTPYLRIPASSWFGAALLLGVISVARSPSSAIAIISELKASGRYTNLVLTTTVAMDVLVIVLFSVVVTLVNRSVSGGTGEDLWSLMATIAELVASLALGVVLGYAICVYEARVGVELSILLACMGLFVIKLARLLPEILEASVGGGLHFEPLLICMAAGFTVSNLSTHGQRFLLSIEQISVPIFAVFFALSGAMMNLDFLRAAWAAALALVALRIVYLAVGFRLASLMGRIPNPERGKLWLGFITQAGVSLGLASEMSRRFPDWGPQVATIVIAAISINQVLGPVTFKSALLSLGEGTRPRRINLRDALNRRARSAPR